MSIASVATRGYGTWSTVNKVPTWGYGIGAAVAPAPPEDGWRSPAMSRVWHAKESSRVVWAKPQGK